MRTRGFKLRPIDDLLEDESPLSL